MIWKKQTIKGRLKRGKRRKLVIRNGLPREKMTRLCSRRFKITQRPSIRIGNLVPHLIANLKNLWRS